MSPEQQQKCELFLGAMLDTHDPCIHTLGSPIQHPVHPDRERSITVIKTKLLTEGAVRDTNNPCTHTGSPIHVSC